MIKYTETTIPEIQESVNRFFSYHEKVKNLQSELLKIDAEIFLCQQLMIAFNKIDQNPFDMN